MVCGEGRDSRRTEGPKGIIWTERLLTCEGSHGDMRLLGTESDKRGSGGKGIGLSVYVPIELITYNSSKVFQHSEGV